MEQTYEKIMRKKQLVGILYVVAGIFLLWLYWPEKVSVAGDPEAVAGVPELEYGIDTSGYERVEGTISPGDNLSLILSRYGVSAGRVDSLSRRCEGIFDVRSIRADDAYEAFISKDSLRRLCHLVYRRSPVEFFVFSVADTLSVTPFVKEVRIERRVAEASIESSLYNAIAGQNLPISLALDLSDIYAWTVDFFGLQKGDAFRVIYDERRVDSTLLGTGRIWGAWFDSGGKRYYAIPFDQNEKISYWDESGNSLRKNLLKAPLQFSRISSKFSGGRLHPVLRIVRAHYGIDYAAPSGTPVHAIADGVITAKGWRGGGGNTVKIRHPFNGLESGYLHLRGYAPGLAIGQRVSQGELIGYVGSTGLSTGPHLDFRVWQHGKPIDPLKIPSEPAEPVAESNRERFAVIRDMVVGGLDATYPIERIALGAGDVVPNATTTAPAFNYAYAPLFRLP
ncbi:MAG: peptidoglycan DD-metalloendopeptidase family protein [Rikenellaceae bacterium]|jgi:murein DD-endopeptidase MepM/ murein hydrolase activator NlpD|nr:peptidoglycan DD-metalloendopeptidase family protein [Rikenellaceae bacterium]